MDDKGFSSTMTTHHDIGDLVSDKIFEIKKDRPNSQTHHLVINDENSFNLIENALSEIEASIDLFDQLDDIRKQKQKIRETPEFSQFRKFRNAFAPCHHKANLTALLCLLAISNKKIHSESSYKLLVKRLIELIIRLNEQVWYWMPHDYDFELYSAAEYLKDFFRVERIKKSPEYTRLVENEITKIENVNNVLGELDY